MEKIKKMFIWTKEFVNKYINKDMESSFQFNSLTPTDNADDCDVYIESLNWALANKNKIKNIAVSGPYGSGKSSVIRTFIKEKNTLWNKLSSKFLVTKYKFLNISLATFRNTENDESDKPNGMKPHTKNLCDTELQRLIELSILQQLLFYEEDSKIPDSRFKKIQKQSKLKLFGFSSGLVLLILSSFLIFEPEFSEKFAILNILNKQTENKNLINLIASTTILIGLFFVTFKVSRYFTGLSIKKLNINAAEIEIDDSISKSILNHHIDEIIYFFEATKYNVVIIEDLDRFGQEEVFTKLREINLLINNSEKIKRDIVFIYAIKDDMFLDKSRVKFFDFIIPIIPVINFSNSGEKLRKIVKENNYKIKEDLLDNLSMFIGDMRLLYNIMNEFFIYSRKISNSLDMNKLLAMIVYKNIHPNDFAKLGDNKGDLYSTITRKTDYIREAVSELDDRIAALKKDIQRIEEQRINDLKELKIIYIAKIIEKIPNVNVSLKVNNDSIFSFADKDNFSQILQGSITYNYRDHYNRDNVGTHPFKFSDIEKEVNPNLSYKEREDLISDKSRINIIKKEIENLNKRKSQIQKNKLKDLLKNKLMKTGDDENSNHKNDLINILLRNGYIDENYLDYISIFHEGALTKIDFQFLINVKTEKNSEFDFRLNKTEELLKKIDEFAFEKEYILNFNIVDAIIKNNKFESKKKLLFEQLSNEKEKSISFINEFIDKTVNIELFIGELCKYWLNIWDYINSKTSFTRERIEKYFLLIIQHAEIKDIIVIFKNSNEYLNNYPDFLNIQTREDKLKQIMTSLNLKLNIIEKNSPDHLLNFLFENNHYAINPVMIEIFASIQKVYQTESFHTHNYSFILSTGLQKLINYVESNIEEYIVSVFLKLDENNEEKLENYIKLLNNEDLDVKLKEHIIIKTNTIIEDINSIDLIDVRNSLLKNLKMKPAWENILIMFEENDNNLNDELLAFINTTQNAEKLSKKEMSTEENENGISIYAKLCDEIIYNNNIHIEFFKLLIKSIPWLYNSFEKDKLSEDKIVLLIENRIMNPTVESFSYLTEHYKGINILLLEKHLSQFKDIIDELSIDGKDLELILKSGIIDVKYKFMFINNLDEETITEIPENIKIIAKFLIDSDAHTVSDSLKRLLITSKTLSAEERLLLFNKNPELIHLDTVDEFIISLGDKYEIISDRSRKATIENNIIHRKFLKNLEKIGYISSFSEVDTGFRINHKRMIDQLEQKNE